MPVYNTKDGKPYFQASFKGGIEYETKLDDLCRITGADNESSAIREAIDRILDEKRSKCAEAMGQFGLTEIIVMNKKTEQSLILTMTEAKMLTVVGEDFGWFSDYKILLDALRARLISRRPTRVFTPHPVSKPEPDRDNRLRAIFEYIGRDLWDVVKSSQYGDVLMRTLGTPTTLPYTCLMTEAQCWIKHHFAATPRHPIFWIYEKAEERDNFYSALVADLKALDTLTMQHPGWDLLERYRPKQVGAKAK